MAVLNFWLRFRRSEPRINLSLHFAFINVCEYFDFHYLSLCGHLLDTFVAVRPRKKLQGIVPRVCVAFLPRDGPAIPWKSVQPMHTQLAWTSAVDRPITSSSQQAATDLSPPTGG
jgi:hypothetical protein